jgi:hypothetical protein
LEVDGYLRDRCSGTSGDDEATGVRRPPLFTARDIWLGSFYELAIELGPRSDDRLNAAAAVMWQQSAMLEGPYADSDREPWEQERVSPSLIASGEATTHLFGIAKLPQERSVACGCCAVRDNATATDWLDLYITLGALETVYDIEYRWNDAWSDWTRPLDDWFADIARSVHDAVPFALALIGEEVSGETSASELAATGVPETPGFALLVPDQRGHLAWYPRTH